MGTQLNKTAKDKISLTWAVNGYFFWGYEWPKVGIFMFVVYLGMKGGELGKRILNSESWLTDENTAQGNAMNETSVILFELHNHSEKQKHDYF